MRRYPQVLVNVRVKDKSGWEQHPDIKQAVAAAAAQLGDNGQILVRASGTEPLIRIMAEGPNQIELENLAGTIADVVSKSLA